VRCLEQWWCSEQSCSGRVMSFELLIAKGTILY